MLRSFAWGGGLLCLMVVVCCLLVPASALAAASGAWDDPAGDAVYPDVDVRRVGAVYSDGVLAVGVNTGLLISGDRLDVYVDTDLNGATGWLGAEYAFFFEQYGTGQAMPVGVWNGSTWTLVQPRTLAYQSGAMGVQLAISRAELGNPGVVRIFARGGHANPIGVGARYSDWAPNSGSYYLDLGLASSVGGASGGGEVTPPPPVPPRASLTVTEARRATLRGMRAKLGKRARVQVARSCARLSAATRRCGVSARRGALRWRGRMTVTEHAIGSALERRARFVGTRTDTACQRRVGTRAARARCTRAARW